MENKNKTPRAVARGLDAANRGSFLESVSDAQLLERTNLRT